MEVILQASLLQSDKLTTDRKERKNKTSLKSICKHCDTTQETWLPLPRSEVQASGWYCMCIVCWYVAPPGECHYNTLLCCEDYFSSSSVVSRSFSVLCAYSKFGHHPHPLGYLCAKFCFFCGLHCWASPWRKITYSINHPAYLMPLEQRHAFRNNKVIKLDVWLKLMDSQLSLSHRNKQKMKRHQQNKNKEYEGSKNISLINQTVER